MSRGVATPDRATRLPGTVQSRVDSVVDETTGLYTVRVLGNVFVARAAQPAVFTYEEGEPVVVTRLGASTEWVILGSIAESAGA